MENIDTRGIQLITTQEVDESIYEVIGLVSGLEVRALNIFKQFLGGISSIFGGKQDLSGITREFESTRRDAIQKMITQAKKKKATRVIGINVSMSDISMGRDNDGMLVVIATGTAIVRKPGYLKKGGVAKKLKSGKTKSKIKKKTSTNT